MSKIQVFKYCRARQNSTNAYFDKDILFSLGFKNPSKLLVLFRKSSANDVLRAYFQKCEKGVNDVVPVVIELELNANLYGEWIGLDDITNLDAVSLFRVSKAATEELLTIFEGVGLKEPIGNLDKRFKSYSVEAIEWLLNEDIHFKNTRFIAFPAHNESGDIFNVGIINDIDCVSSVINVINPKQSIKLS